MLDAQLALSHHVHEACKLLHFDQSAADEYVLLVAAKSEYLTAEGWLDGIPASVTASPHLELVPSPQLEVHAVLEELRSEALTNDAHEQKKQRVHWMCGRLRLAQWAEELVAQDGLAALFELLEASDGRSALQGYCLQALRQALAWSCAMAELCASPSLARTLFSLVYCARPRVVSRALELLFVCCAATETLADSTLTFSTVLDAAAAAARAHDEEPLAIVVAHLSSADVDVQLNALTLLNCLLSASGSWERRQRLVFSLDSLGANEALLGCPEQIDVRFQHQLQL